MKKLFCALSAATLTAAAVTSCDHKDLCFDHDAHALKYHARIAAGYELEWQYTYDATDWRTAWPDRFGMAYDDLRPAVPAGLRVLVYGGASGRDLVNLPAEGGDVSLRDGELSMLMYNNDTEYIVFDALDSYASAKATTRTRTRTTYLGNSYVATESENTVNPPDMLFGHYIGSYTAEKSAEPQPLGVMMHPLVFTYLVRYEFSHGLEYVSLARGALAGMAADVYLHDGHTSENEATLLYDCTVEEFGAQAVVNSFGVPDYPNGSYTRAGRRYGLNLEVRLRNGNIKSFDFDVTDQVAAQPHGGVIVVSGIAITDEEGESGGSGFDVDIRDWGEFEDIPLPLK